jgi:hypothetical protein
VVWMNGWLDAVAGSGELSELPCKFNMTKATRRVPLVAAMLLAVGLLTVLFGAALGIEMHNAAPARAGVNFPLDRPSPPVDPAVTVTTVVTRTSVTTVTATFTTTVPGPATSTVYSCGPGYHDESRLCVGNGPVVN